MATPLVMTSIGEIFAERSGVINIGLEGMMLTGALGGMLGSYFTGSPWAGLLVGMGAGFLLAGLFSLVTVYLGGDQVVMGAALNLLALGLTGVFYRQIFGTTGTVLTTDRYPVNRSDPSYREYPVRTYSAGIPGFSSGACGGLVVVSYNPGPVYPCRRRVTYGR